MLTSATHREEKFLFSVNLSESNAQGFRAKYSARKIKNKDMGHRIDEIRVWQVFPLYYSFLFNTKILLVIIRGALTDYQYNL